MVGLGYSNVRRDSKPAEYGLGETNHWGVEIKVKGWHTLRVK